MKKSDRFMLLPRASTATKTYAFVKIILSFLFMAYFASLVAWTAHSMLFFKEKIEESSEYTRENQRYKTHNHFFLFTGLYIGAATLVGLWGVLKENIETIFGFLGAYGIGFLFEITGAIKSQDDDVKKLKFVSVSLEPLLMLLALGFCLMIRAAEKRVASVPVFRQAMAESRRNSFDKSDLEKTGHDNPTLDLTDEMANRLDLNNRMRSDFNEPTSPATLDVNQSYLDPKTK